MMFLSLVKLRLKCFRALILPSHLRSEAYGMVLLEAAIFGRPQVSCEIGTGVTFVNAHEETGFVEPPESPAALGDRDEWLAGRCETLAYSMCAMSDDFLGRR